MKHHLQVKSAELDVRVFIMDAQAVSKLVLQQMGAGVLPGHLAQKLIDQGEELQVLKGSGKSLINVISIAQLEDKTLSNSAKETLGYLRTQLKR
jgi:DNA-binding transcriptional LysR family regulator